LTTHSPCAPGRLLRFGPVAPGAGSGTRGGEPGTLLEICQSEEPTAQPAASSDVVADVIRLPVSPLCTGAWRRALVALCLWACALAATAALAGPAHAARSRAPALAPNDAVIDGPSPDIRALNGLSMSRDGGGALVYTKAVAGVAHVFVSRLSGGAFQSPVQVDAGLAGPSSQPVVAAGQNGLVLVAFTNGGTVYVSQATSTVSPFSAPSALATDAANPSLSLNLFGKAYLAYTDAGGAGGGDVRVAYYLRGQWTLVAGALDATPSDAAGVGTGRPYAVAGGDGVGIVAWGEAGHIYTRRAIGTRLSTVVEQADAPTFAGWSETSASRPSIASGGDSTYAAVAFQETLSNGSTTQSRVMLNRLHGGAYDGAAAADGATTGGPEGADQPQVAVTEYGRGFVTSETDQTHALYATTLGNADNPGQTQRVDSLPNGGAPDAAPATAGLVSNLVAWQQTPGTSGPAEIRVRYASDGADLGPEQLVSTPTLGATDADRGLADAGDVAGDAAVAWVQGSGAGTSIVAAQLFQAPGGFVASNSFRYVVTASPALYWSPAAELWGAPTYVVRIDGTPVGQTTATRMVPPAPLADGRHSYQLSAVNLAGATTNAATATVFVDTVAPRAIWKLRGTSVVNTRERLRVAYSDPPPAGLPSSAASGVASVYVNWGDRSPRARIRRTTASHVYERIRTYTITITLTDRAGNRTVIIHKLKIRAKPKPKRHHRGKGSKRGRARQ
jgi:hypothetical protein